MPSATPTCIEKMMAMIPLQVRAVSCAKQFKCVSDEKHIEAIAGGLEFARLHLQYVTQKLWTAGDERVEQHIHQTLHKEMMCGILFLMSALDAIVIADTVSANDLSTHTSFFNTALRDPQHRALQEEIKSLESYQYKTNTKSANLLTVSNFFKHYMPSAWMPKTFQIKNTFGKYVGIQDFFIPFGEEESGPILHDLVIPAYNKACDLILLMAETNNVHVGVRKILAV